jgi:hypothetical protein
MKGNITMGAFGAVDIPNRGVEDHRKALQDREAKLANAKRQRDIILADIGKANAAVDSGDKQARNALPGLNKSNLEVGRLILSIGREVSEARGRLSLATNQAAAAAAKRAEVDNATLIRDKLYECACPDGRRVRHHHYSLEALRNELQPGYRAIGQVFGANADNTGGFIADPKSDMMQAMLDAYGDTLLAWLAERGVVGDKTVVVLPHNGRDL